MTQTHLAGKSKMNNNNLQTRTLTLFGHTSLKTAIILKGNKFKLLHNTVTHFNIA